LDVMASKQKRYTFDDQVLFALAILRMHEAVRREYSRTVEHILIDEFQDFTPAAASLLLALSHASTTVLAFGDRDQAIRPKMTRSAALFGQFGQQDSCGGPHRLHTNFRSTQAILDLATYIRNVDEPADGRRAALRAARAPAERPPMVPTLFRVPS